MAWVGVLFLTTMGLICLCYGAIAGLAAWFLSEDQWEVVYGAGGALAGLYLIWLAWRFAPFEIVLT